MARTAAIHVAADRDDVAIDVLEIAGDRDLLDRIRDDAVLDPESGGAARVVARDRIDALAELLGDEEPAPHPAHQRRQIVVAVGHHQIVTAARIAGRDHAELAAE